MFDFVTDVMFEPTELEKCIKTFTTNISAEIVEKQNELILTTIQRIGDDEFIDITIDKDKVIEALTDYVNKQKGIPNIEVRHGEWIDLNIAEWQCSKCNYRVERWNNTPYCHNCGAKMDGGKNE